MTHILVDKANTFFRARHVIRGDTSEKVGMADDYQASEFYQYHDPKQVPVLERPNKYYQIFFAKKINAQFLQQDISVSLGKFQCRPTY
jgi:hypothetical protein